MRRIEAEYKAWERRARSEDEWIRETHDGELAVSEENNVSEVTEICNPKVAKGCFIRPSPRPEGARGQSVPWTITARARGRAQQQRLRRCLASRARAGVRRMV